MIDLAPLAEGYADVLNSDQFNFTLVNMTDNVPSIIKIQGNILNTLINDNLFLIKRPGNSSSNNKVHIKNPDSSTVINAGSGKLVTLFK